MPSQSGFGYLRLKQKGRTRLKRLLILISSMPLLPILISLFIGLTAIHAEPATEKMQFESDTNSMSKEEVKMYMGRDPDQLITPHLWRYSGNWTSKKFGEGMDTYNTVDITFGMLTDSHKYGVTGYTWSVQ
jgi:hypothetical protein